MNTNRTDELAGCIGFSQIHPDFLEHAHTLERELAAAEKNLADAQSDIAEEIKQGEKYKDELTATNEKLKAFERVIAQKNVDPHGWAITYANQLTAALLEIESLKHERNEAAMLERGKYLPIFEVLKRRERAYKDFVDEIEEFTEVCRCPCGVAMSDTDLTLMLNRLRVAIEQGTK